MAVTGLMCLSCREERGCIWPLSWSRASENLRSILKSVIGAVSTEVSMALVLYTLAQLGCCLSRDLQQTPEYKKARSGELCTLQVTARPASLPDT